ncbi:MAG: hypothetical protein KJ062_05830 [Thermoanaerobaculia bacterium]|nr:hypothetical protein [Thermoanaerobaculia bacterium]
MTVLILLFLFLTGGDPVLGDGATTAPVTTTEPADDPVGDEGGEGVRKTPIG